MDEVLQIVVLGRAARNGSNIKNRQPLSAMYVKSRPLSEFYQEIIEEELNVKSVVFKEDMSDFTSYSFKPQLKTLGPRYGKKLGEIRTLLSELDGSAAKKELDSTGFLRRTLADGTEVEFAPADLLIEMVKSTKYFSVEDQGITVAIDTTLTPELLEEGMVREIISKVQTMRKEAGFEVTDHIKLNVTGDEAVLAALTANKALVSEEVLADEVETAAAEGYTKDWDINGKNATITVAKIG